jgi:hypothetical protein
MKLRQGVVAGCVLLNSSLVWGAGPDLPPGPMKKKVQSTCLECHDATRITKQKHDKKWWAQTLSKMVGLGAQVDDDERDALLDYLSKNFGASKAPAKSSKK